MSYQISEELNLVLVYYSGVLNMNELIVQSRAMIENPAYHPSYHVMYDLRDCHFDIKLSDFELAIHEAKQNPVYRFEKRVAILVNKPKETILTLSFIATLKSFVSGQMEVFYAVGVALQFVEVSFTEKRRIEHLLKKLREVS
jgi:hypothetical protein